MEHYSKGNYIDAQDTTLNFCMAKITEVINNEIQVNFDGWSNKWDSVSWCAIHRAMTKCGVFAFNLKPPFYVHFELTIGFFGVVV